jgi:heptosyltransferase III
MLTFHYLPLNMPAFLRRLLAFDRGSEHRLRALIWAVSFAFPLRIRLYWLRIKGKYPICIALTEHIGDIAAAEPLAKRVRDEYPKASIHWIILKQHAALVEHNPDIDFVIRTPCVSGWFYLSRYVSFDRTLDLHVHPRECSICKWPRITSPFQQANISSSNYYNYGSLLAVFSNLAAIPFLDAKPTIHLTYDDTRTAAKATPEKEFIVVHCVSRDDQKNWPAENWQELVNLIIKNTNLLVVELGTTAILTETPRTRNLCGQLSIRESAALIAKASFFIGIDSAPAHFANAMSTQALILLGSYASFETYTPFSGHNLRSGKLRTLQTPGSIKELTVECVWRACLEQTVSFALS